MQEIFGAYIISDDKKLLDQEAIHTYLSQQSYWARGLSRRRLQKAIENSFCFGLYHGNKTIGFARVITDHATVAYLADVYIDPEYQNRGWGKKLMRFIIAHPDLQDLRRWFLATKDAHDLYRPFGFTELSQPERFMEWLNKTAFDGGWKIE